MCWGDHMTSGAPEVRLERQPIAKAGRLDYIYLHTAAHSTAYAYCKKKILTLNLTFPPFNFWGIK